LLFCQFCQMSVSRVRPLCKVIDMWQRNMTLLHCVFFFWLEFCVKPTNKVINPSKIICVMREFGIPCSQENLFLVDIKKMSCPIFRIRTSRIALWVGSLHWIGHCGNSRTESFEGIRSGSVKNSFTQITENKKFTEWIFRYH